MIRELAGFTATLDSDDLDPEVSRMARACVLDWFGCAVAGAVEPGPRILRDVLANSAGEGRSTLIGAGLRSDAATAAMHNGFASHVLDFDDVHIHSQTHISAPVFAAMLAVGEETGASPLEIMVAFVAGFEAMGRIGRLVGSNMINRYHVHPTGFLGYFGAACGAGRLLGLDADGMVTAWGIAGGQAGGLIEVRGTMSKGFFAGHSASGGVQAARLAAAGFGSANDILGGEDGVLAAFDARDRADLPAAPRWEILENKFKVHACCALSHPMIDALLAVRDATDAPALSAIERVRVRLSPPSAAYLDRPARTGLEGKFSGQFSAAVALADGSAGPGQFTDARAADPDVIALMQRVELVPDDRLDLEGAGITLSLAGQEVHRDVDAGSSGTARVDEERLMEKFVGLTSPHLGPAAETTAASIMRWPDTDLGELLATLRVMSPLREPRTPRPAAR